MSYANLLLWFVCSKMQDHLHSAPVVEAGGVEVAPTIVRQSQTAELPVARAVEALERQNVKFDKKSQNQHEVGFAVTGTWSVV